MTDGMPSLTHKAEVLMYKIRQQIFVPEVTTFGPCPHCDRTSRGARPCEFCLTKELSYIVGKRVAHSYLTACVAQREAEQTVLLTIQSG